MAFPLRKRRKDKLFKYTKRDVIFYIALMAFSIAQFVIFYIVVNVNSLLLAFQNYDVLTNITTYVGFDNFKEAFRILTTSSDMIDATKYSLLAFVLSTVITTPLALLFSYYIYKKMLMSGFFRVLLFLPSIISAIIMVTIFRFFVERGVPEIANKLFGVEDVRGLLENPDTRFGMVMFYNIWVGFGINVLMYSNTMSGILPDVIEAGRVDGVSGFKEFWYLIFPHVYSTFTTFLIVGVSGIFINQLNLYSFYGGSSPIQTYGYWIYVQTANAKSKAEYPVISAFGIIFTVIIVPVTFAVRKALVKFGPREE